MDPCLSSATDLQEKDRIDLQECHDLLTLAKVGKGGMSWWKDMGKMYKHAKFMMENPI